MKQKDQMVSVNLIFHLRLGTLSPQTKVECIKAVR
ncbi:hypothetical protein BARD7_01663 [Bacillus amyloliquefaciens]|nr:hypothetical protein BARD7_01663 [Bacillus amyloliquefaciens]